MTLPVLQGRSAPPALGPTSTEAEVKRALTAAGLSRTTIRIRILAAVAHGGPLLTRQIAREVAANSESVSHVLERLEWAGLVMSWHENPATRVRPGATRPALFWQARKCTSN